MTEDTHSSEIRRQAIIWLTKKHSGAFSKAEQDAFKRWLDSNPMHRTTFDQIERAWDSLPYLDVELEPAGNSERLFQPVFFAKAAGLILVISLGLQEGWPLFDDSLYQTAKGESRQIELADGSQVSLNTDSKIALHYNWNKRSIELLQGEALFSVAPHKLRPFEVYAGGGVIQDIGTRFDVYASLHANRISVLEGSIALKLNSTGEQRQTEAGQTMSYNANAILSEPEPSDINQLTAWLNHKLVFRNTPLVEVINELERYHPVKFQLNDPGLASLRLGGVFDNKDLQRFLFALEVALPVEVKHHKSGAILINRRKNKEADFEVS